MPLPDDIQLESLGFWGTMREQRGFYVACQRLCSVEKRSQRQDHEDAQTRPVVTRNTQKNTAGGGSHYKNVQVDEGR